MRYEGKAHREDGIQYSEDTSLLVVEFFSKSQRLQRTSFHIPLHSNIMSGLASFEDEMDVRGFSTYEELEGLGGFAEIRTAACRKIEAVLNSRSVVSAGDDVEYDHVGRGDPSVCELLTRVSNEPLNQASTAEPGSGSTMKQRIRCILAPIHRFLKFKSLRTRLVKSHVVSYGHIDAAGSDVTVTSQNNTNGESGIVVTAVGQIGGFEDSAHVAVTDASSASSLYTFSSSSASLPEQVNLMNSSLSKLNISVGTTAGPYDIDSNIHYYTCKAEISKSSTLSGEGTGGNSAVNVLASVTRLETVEKSARRDAQMHAKLRNKNSIFLSAPSK